MLSQSWNGESAEDFSDEGYVADSVGEEKFRRLVIEVGFGLSRVVCKTDLGGV
jgi:hypothetical protein